MGERFVETLFYVFHKVDSLSGGSGAFFGVRFVETVFYVFLKVVSLPSGSAIFFGERFVETVFYVFHKVHSLSSETAIILLFAVGLGMCISSRWFAMFLRNPCVLHDLRAILTTIGNVHFVETVCHVSMKHSKPSRRNASCDMLAKCPASHVKYRGCDKT